MRKLLTIFAAFLLLGSVAFGQNITKSLQGSQDPRGPVGLDPSNSSYFPGHVNIFGGATPTMSTAQCFGTGSISANSIDNAGRFLSGGGATCNWNFGTVFNVAPWCMVQPPSASGITSTPTFTATTSAIYFTSIASTTTYNYLCFSNQ